MAHQLGQTKGEELVGYLVNLFPRWKPNVDQRAVVCAMFARTTLDEEQLRAILANSMTEGKGFSPPIESIKLKMKNAVQQACAIEGMADRIRTPTAPPGGKLMYITEGCAHERATNSQWYRDVSPGVRASVNRLADAWEKHKQVRYDKEMGIEDNGPTKTVVRLMQ